MFLWSCISGLAKSGFSDLFLPGTSCGSTCSGHTRYDPYASTTAQDLGQTFNITYGDGSSAAGEQFSDTVSISGLTVRSAFFATN